MIDEKNELKIHIVVLLSIAYTTYYLIWRLTTFNPDALWLSWIF